GGGRSVLAAAVLAAGPRIILIWKGFVGAAVVAFCYQLVHWSNVVDPRVLPSVTTVLAEMGRLSVNPEFLVAVGETLWPALGGLLGACLIGIPLGLLLGISRLADRMSRLLIDIMRSLPGTALIPIFIVTVGQGDVMKVLLVIYIGVWPILFNT